MKKFYYQLKCKQYNNNEYAVMPEYWGNAILKGIVTAENSKKAREIIKNRIEIKDEVFRSYGILKNAVIMSKKEAFELISNIRMGINMGIINDIKLENIDKLIENIGKNTLKKNFKEDFSKEQENIKRAEYIKSNI